MTRIIETGYPGIERYGDSEAAIVLMVVIRTMAPPVFSGGIRSSTMIKRELNIMEIPDPVKKRQAY